MLTTFNNSFTAAFSDELPKEMKHDLSPHLKSVAALPREVQLHSCSFILTGIMYTSDVNIVLGR